MKPKYLTKIYWSEDDDACVAEVPALPGCGAHSTSYETAARHIAEAMDFWLASARKHSDPIPIPEPDVAAEEISRLTPFLNVSKLARLAGINKNTLTKQTAPPQRFYRRRSPSHPCRRLAGKMQFNRGNHGCSG